MHSTCPQESFEHFSLKKLWFWNEFRTLSEKIPDFARKVGQGLRNFNLRVRRKIVREKNLKKWWCFGNFVLWAKKIELWAKQFGRGCQSCIWRVQRNLLSIFHWKNDDFWMIFGLWAKKNRNSPKFYGRFPKLQSTCPEKKFERQKMKKKRWFLGNFVLRVKKLDFGQNSLAMVVKDAFGVSRAIFWAFFIEETMISEWNSYFERKSSGLCQNFTADFRNSNLRVRRKFVREKKIEKMMITK